MKRITSILLIIAICVCSTFVGTTANAKTKYSKYKSKVIFLVLDYTYLRYLMYASQIHYTTKGTQPSSLSVMCLLVFTGLFFHSPLFMLLYTIYTAFRVKVSAHGMYYFTLVNFIGSKKSLYSEIFKSEPTISVIVKVLSVNSITQ